MLYRRLISALILVSIVLLLVWLDFYLGSADRTGKPGLVMAGLVMLVAVLAAGELTRLWNDQQAGLNAWLAIGGTALIALMSLGPVLWPVQPGNCPVGMFGWSASGLSLAIGLVFVVEILGYSGARATDRLARYVLMFGYFYMFFAFLAPHRLLKESNPLGIFAILTLVFTVKISDAAAFFVGKAIGTVKLAPRLSPGKTWQGAGGALIGGCLAAGLMFYAVGPLAFGLPNNKPIGWIIAYALAVTIAGIMGDFAESLLKRDAACKDSSKWLPGLGGILDVMDSLIFAAPVSYLMWILAE